MKAIGLFSGGLDSACAIKVVQEQGIEVIAFHYSTPFMNVIKQNNNIEEQAKQLGVELKIISHEQKFIDIVKEPKHGHGKNINPCIDCKIFILREAVKYAKEVGAKFIFTGEVLGQRPMSQRYKTLMLIQKEAGLDGKLLRPLCAKLLPETEAEKKGYINREKLLEIQGRTRKQQMELAKKYKLEGFIGGNSGCKLTDKEYSKRVRDMFEHIPKPNLNDIQLLSLGRHFRAGNSKILVGRDEIENDFLEDLKQKDDFVFQAKDIMGPSTLLQGEKSEQAIELAAQLTARYSDSKQKQTTIKYGKEKLNKEITAEKVSQLKLRKIRI